MAIPSSSTENVFVMGIFEGYQTYDGIASLIIGGVITVSLNMDRTLSFAQKRRINMSNRRYSGSEPRYNDKKTVSGRLQTRDVGFDRKLPDGKQYIGQLHKAGNADDKLYGARVNYRLG